MTELLYNSTRDKHNVVTASQAILKGIAEDGGLYVPQTIPTLTFDWQTLAEQSYQEVALLILSQFLTDFTEVELKECIAKAYDEKFDVLEIAPVISLDNETHILELFHGNTIAFKDMALSILPHLMTTAARKHQLQEEIVILTATSGDTGKAAMAGFADVPNTRIIVFYPKHGVSRIQEQQMLTQTGENTTVVGIEGNFDDAQTKVKELFADEALNKELKQRGFQFSSANSINIGRLVPQVVYYVYAYAQLVKAGVLHAGDMLNVDVPTGNFGNILAAYYAKQMGVPIGKLLCASNQNHVLTDFFHKGIYDKNRHFYTTSSPSMDILVSSNLERLIYDLLGKNATETKSLMKALEQFGSYELMGQSLDKLSEQFESEYASDQATAQAIKQEYDKYQYVFDPHTAVAMSVYRKYQQRTNDTTPMLIVSTASPYKFPRSVVAALEEVDESLTDFELVDSLHELTQLPIPRAVTSVMNAPIRHDKVVEIDQMRQTVLEILH